MHTHGVAHPRLHSASQQPIRLASQPTARPRRRPVAPPRAQQQQEPPPPPAQAPTAASTTPPPLPPPPASNAPLAGSAVALGVLAFAASRLVVGGASLAALEDEAVPLDEALRNGRPTVVEFYASWCEVCKELVPAELDVERRYSGRVNFVLLNVENPKWAPEVAEYAVGGIPHFVFLDDGGRPLAAAVGRLPSEVLEGNVAALAQGQRELPYARVRGETSALSNGPGGGSMAGPRMASPRDHA